VTASKNFKEHLKENFILAVISSSYTVLSIIYDAV